MAVEQPGFAVGFMKAAANLSAKQFYCVKATAAETFNICTVSGEAFLGVLQDKPLAGSPGNIMKDGITKIMIGVGGLVAGQWMTAADGTAIQATAGHTSAGTVLIGGVAGELASVTLGTQEGGAGALATNGIVAPATGKMVNGGSYTTTSGDASANTLSIAHGLTTPAAVIVQVLDAGNNVVTTDADVTISGANIVVADGSTYNTVAGQIIKWIAFGV